MNNKTTTWLHPIGTKVRYWPILWENGQFDGYPFDTETRSESWLLGCGDEVVSLVGKTGGYHIDHLEIIKKEKI